MGLKTRVLESLDKDAFDLVEQVYALMLGGVLGGMSLRVIQANQGWLVEWLSFIILFIIGFVLFGTLHLIISFFRSSPPGDG